jgi:aconitate hydratase
MKKETYVRKIEVNGQAYTFYDIQRLQTEGLADIARLPFSIRILVENLLRKMDGEVVKAQDLLNIAGWRKSYDAPLEIPYHPARVLMQDFTGVPAVVDLAAMRDAVEKLGGDPAKVNPLVPVDLVIDHSVQVDAYGTEDAVVENVRKEYERNGERYAFLKWAQKSFDNFKVVPPRSGICHQVNLEHVGRVVMTVEEAGKPLAFPDTLVGLDSHTTMIDAVGVMGWGVGGIEAEAVMLGQPYYMSIPRVIGVRLTGELQPGVTATDMVLTVTEMLRNYGVVEKFVEFFGEGMKKLTVPDRATISNMTPEYGATLGFFPVDEKTIDYLRLTGRDKQAGLVEAYTKANALFYTGSETPEYSDVLELDLATVQPCVSGPSRPQDRIALPDLKTRFAEIIGCAYDRNEDMARISQFHDESGTRTSRLPKCFPVEGRACEVEVNGHPVKMRSGLVVIAAITSCTNTSNPNVLIGAGLLAKKAVERGLKVPPFVKTSLAPGSKVVMQYLTDAGLMPYLEALGFHLAGFGCTTCIGNSGPLNPVIEQCIVENDLNVASVLSGNRNFEARIHQNIKSNFLASPMLVVAYALAGHIDIDMTYEPVGLDPNGRPVYLEEIWPSNEAIAKMAEAHVKKEFFELEYGRIFDGDEFWNQLPDVQSVTYKWDENSTYIKNPPYFEGFSVQSPPVEDIAGAKALVLLGDTVTTDHISPAGAIPEAYPAGKYLVGQGVAPEQFNSYGSRRGNHEVMMRGTFGNIRLKNLLVGGKEGSYTLKFPEKEERYIYEVAMAYQKEKMPAVVLAGKEYGTGSSRDWAAKGSNLLGVRAVITESFERIHRSNLVGMGVLPLVFNPGENASSLGLDGSENFSIEGLAGIQPRQQLTVTAEKSDGSIIDFTVTARLDTDVEVAYFRHGGILPYVLRKIIACKNEKKADSR